MKTALCVPTLNAENTMRIFLESLELQSVVPDELLFIDSSSDDNTTTLLHSFGARVIVIPRTQFNHGATRQLGVELCPDADIIFFITQDAIIAHPESLSNLLACFKDENVGAAFGRQLPHSGANPIEAHSRLFNYPNVSRLRSLDDAPELGIKTAFMSNSFAAYRRKTLMAVGGFPKRTISTEDTYVAAKMLLTGWKIAYCAEAKVYHSHNYTFLQEFKRYFDIGVFYGKEKWIRQAFGQAEGEGLRFVKSEINYLLDNGLLLIPSSILRTLVKFLGYKLGFIEKRIPLSLKILLTGNKNYWLQ